MAPWLSYVRERFPLPSYVLIIGAMVGSAWTLYGLRGDALGAVLTGIGALLFYFTLRLMDEIKDYQKDLVAHPERPLARGLIPVSAAQKVVRAGLGLMLLIAVSTGLAQGARAGLSFLIVTLHLFLMYREFYIGKWLSARPLLYALSHQLIVLPLVLFGVAACYPNIAWGSTAFGLALTSLGGFFAYEVGRKQDPAAHPLLQTYQSLYGTGGSLGLTVLALAVSLSGAALVGTLPILMPAALLLVASYLWVLRAPQQFKLIEALATLNLLLSLGSGLAASLGG